MPENLFGDVIFGFEDNFGRFVTIPGSLVSPEVGTNSRRLTPAINCQRWG
jgi:hypothetical protein